MKYSVMTEPHLGGTYQQQLEVARWGEDIGLISFARCDHYLSEGEPPPDATDAFAVLAGLARDTESIRLCVLVSPITFRHPAVIAKNAATIDQMSDGRLDLGVGTGWMDLEHAAFGIPFPEWGERWERFEESLHYLEAAFADGQGSYQGRYFQLDADVRPKPENIRLVLGGTGKKRTPTLAGEMADEYNFLTCPPAEARAKIEVMRQAAAGRPVEATLMGPITVGRTAEEYQDRLARAARNRETTPAELETRLENGGYIFGTPNQAKEKVAELEEAGVDRIYVQWIDLDDIAGLKTSFEAILQ